MTPQQTRLVRDSFEAIRAASSPLALLFYARLFELDPSLRGMFKTDMLTQSKKLTDTFAAVLDSLDRFDEVRPELRELGRRHLGYGIRPEHYQTLTQAMLWALSQALQASFDSETRDAWAAALNEINQEMLAGTAGKEGR